MKKIYTLTFALLFAFLTSFGQGEHNKWYFGNMAGLDFNGGPPVALTNGAMFVYDNCTSVADNAGNLLFYSNGVSVWNQNHATMPNGTGLLGSNNANNGAYAVKQPGSNSNYYIFTNDFFAGSNGFKYSVVDMSLQSGLGDVTSAKNIPLLSVATEKIAAVLHSNNVDVWIIAHAWNSNSFNAYLLSSTGLNTTPVVSSIGAVHTGGTNGTYNAMADIQANVQGNKIALAVYDLNIYELFDFNRATGALTNVITIPGYTQAWGVEFSPDGTKLYTTQWTFSSIFQFDITSNNQTTIINSVQNIGTVTSPDPTYKAGMLRLGPDNKIYVAKFTSGFVGVINSPNLSGTACSYVDNGVSLAGRICEDGFPAFVRGINSDGINDLFDQSYNPINAFPNPSNGVFNLSMEGFQDGKKTHISIYNSLGQIIIEEYLAFQKNIPIDASYCKPGIYFIRAVQEDLISTGSIVIKD